MKAIKQHIYWLCEELRRLETLGLENSPRFKQKFEEVQLLQAKYNEAEKRLASYLEACSQQYYYQPHKKKGK